MDAELLLAHVLRIRRSDLRRRLHERLPLEDFTSFAQLVERRLQREPLPYILGEQEFMGLRFRVTPDVLIPRPETEVLVEAVLAQFRVACSVLRVPYGSHSSPLYAPRPAPSVIADIGTGSGAIAVSLAHFLPTAQVYATDISEAALAVARDNARRLGVTARVTFAQGDGCEPLRRLGLQGQLHAIVSNPPYVPCGEIDALQPEVSRYEPCVALDGGADGLRSYRRLAEKAAEFLRPQGFVACEVGVQQSHAVSALFLRPPFSRQDIVKDYSGIERVVMAWR